MVEQLQLKLQGQVTTRGQEGEDAGQVLGELITLYS